MKLLEIITKIQPRFNHQQRVIIASIIPAVLLFTAYGVIGIIAEDRYYSDDPISDFVNTWWMWAITFMIVGMCELFLLRTQNSHSILDCNNEEHKPRFDKKNITWEKGLFRLYIIWIVLVVASMFTDMYWDCNLKEKIGTLMLLIAIPCPLYFILKLSIQRLIIPISKWVARGFVEPNKGI